MTINIQPLDAIGLASYMIAVVLALMIAKDLWLVWKQTGRQISRAALVVCACVMAFSKSTL